MRVCARAYAQIINDMAKQEIWIRLQDDLDRAYSVLRSLIDNKGCVCGLDIDSCRLLFKRISDIKDNKSLQIEFDSLPDNEKYGRAKKMSEVLMQYDLCGGKVSEYDSYKELTKMRQYAHKVNSLDTEMQKWEKDFSRLIYDIVVFVAGYCNDDSGSGRNEPQQYPKELLKMFKNDVSLIKELKDEDRKTVVEKITRWSKEGKCVNFKEHGNKKLFAAVLIKNGIVEARGSDIDKEIDSFRKMF